MGKYKWLKSVGFGLACILILAGCNIGLVSEKTENREKIENTVIKFVNWEGEGSTGPAFDKMIETYETSHKRITIESKVIPYNQLLDQLLIMASSGKAPDCAQIHGSMVSELVASRALEPLDELISPKTREDFYENMLEPLIYDGKIMSLPWVPGPDVLYYNKELLKKAGFEEPPKTSGELYEMAEAIGQLKTDNEANEIYGLGISSKKLAGTGYQFLPYLWAEGGDIVDDQGNVTMDTPEMKNVLKRTGEMMDKGTVPVGLEVNDLRNLFAAGRLGFLFEGDYGPSMFAASSLYGEEFLDKVGAVTAPQGKDGMYMSGFYEHDLGVFSGSEHKKEAADFIQWLSGPEAMEIYSEMAGTKTPARKSVRELEIYSAKTNPVFQIFLESLDKVRAFPQQNPGFQKGMEELAEAIQRVGINHEDVDTVTKELQEKVSGLYES